MSLIDDILAHNQQFVADKQYEPYRTTNTPDKKAVVLTCMDTRLVELLPAAMNLRQGDMKLLKNAGAIVSHPFGSIMRSLLVAVYSLGAADVFVVGHLDCGMTGLSCTNLLHQAVDRGVDPITIATLRNAGIDLDGWLRGFGHPKEGVVESVRMIRNHPLLPKDVRVHGMLMDPATGKLQVVEV
ncbi:MAG TPA: carbonic anhydrase [Tepidisphaeraceae bacterium]|nr:carbonic anhydrase [Tepidisphaeraceae bacterium]